jgi:hypothetical protein
MTPEKQIEALAEFVGWRNQAFLTSHDALMPVLEALTHEHWVIFASCAYDEMNLDDDGPWAKTYLLMKPAEVAKCTLKAIGKWDC